MSLEEEHKTNKNVRKVGPYTIGETLGKGGYSWVKKGVHEKTKAIVALKFMVLEDKKFFKVQGKQVHTEIKSMTRIDNPHVMKLHAYNLKCKYTDKSGEIVNTIVLVLEYCPGGELFDILYYTHQLDSVTARTYFAQMMRGLKACHDIGIVHRDIKPQNLLLDERYQLKITDFGLSFISKEQKDLEGLLLKTRCGTRGYQAPELLKGERYTKACDIFSCGVVLFILLTGYPPFEQAWRDDKWYRPLCDQNPQAFWKKHTKIKIDDDCKKLISGMLAYRAKNRLTLEECLQHKWIVGEKMHTPRELAAAVKEKHRETRSLRRKDKKKMRELEGSVKRKKRLICNCSLTENAKDFRESSYPCCNGVKDVSSFQIELPVVENFAPTLLTFFAWKLKLNEAYDAAVNVFNLALGGKPQTTFSSGNPWNVTTLVKVSDGVSELEFAVALYVREIKGSGIVAFKFKRLQGDSIAFARIWDAAEQCLMAYSDSLFFDVLEGNLKTAEENKEDE